MNFTSYYPQIMLFDLFRISKHNYITIITNRQKLACLNPIVFGFSDLQIEGGVCFLNTLITF